MTSTFLTRKTVDVDGTAASYMTAGDGPIVLLLHGTWWSRVWQPVIEGLAAAGLQPIAVDLPGCGRSMGRLTPETAIVPRLADWVVRFRHAVAGPGPIGLAGHDIGGAIAQHILVHGGFDISRFALVNSVTYDSWPVPGVARFRDPDTVASLTAADIVAARTATLPVAMARTPSASELQDYVSPWSDLRVARSWMAIAAAADSRYTLELVDGLRANTTPKLLVWGEDDTFQPVGFAERFAAEMPETRLVRVPGGGHIPMENDPAFVARAIAGFFTPAGILQRPALSS